ncbi:MAG TPA: sulfotransferase [Novosphingobium sp.]|nr:sulfotransferase [Novosphingobium sp.]
MSRYNPPLLIVGMHRSGTSMLTRILRYQGIFLGHDIQGDDEAWFFLELNRWMLQMAGTDWDYPLPTLDLLSRAEDIATLADVVAGKLSGPGTFRYLGAKWLRAGGRIGDRLTFPWGFKDPRSSLFLPVWLHLFPEARVLRIRRHGIDVAASLKTRHEEIRRTICGHYNRSARLGLAMPRRMRTVDVVRCRTIDGGLGIWSEYEGILDHWMQAIAPDRQMTIRYEDYVVDPAASHAQIGQFVGLPLDAPLPGGISPDPSRAYAYRRNPVLAEDARRLAATLAERGYEA